MVIKVGIDALAIYTSRYALDLTTLAKARNVDPEKFNSGLGQHVMSVPPPGEDIVTMAANAAKQVLGDQAVNDIEMLLFATESGTDQSKAAGMHVHGLLNLPSRCLVVELKQACYAGTAALQLALPFLRENPTKKVLLIASDIARYGLHSVGESSQGAGAIAILLTSEPRIMAIEHEYGIVAENVMDFWRPNYLHEALVDGKYSSKLYLTMLEKSWAQYQQLSGRKFTDHAYFCYHTPVPRLVEKAHQHLLKINNMTDLSAETSSQQIDYALHYGRNIGNSYTASLYIGLASLLDLAPEDLSGKRVGFYSYGSGCMAEYFSGVVQAGYRDLLHTDYHEHLLASRATLSYDEYQAFYTFSYVEDGSHQDIPAYQTGDFRLTKMQQHKRIYEKVEKLSLVQVENTTETVNAFSVLEKKKSDEVKSETHALKVVAPGKLILSGEHSVVYGKPALAMAINRYVTATITPETSSQILFDLSDLSHHSRLSFSALRQLKEKIKRKYHSFIRGDFGIRDVLHKPFELAQYALGVLTESLNLSLPHGVKIQVQSELPMGCGMGSSAATIISVMHAISSYLQVPLTQEKLFQLALEAENMQHGQSSGLDLRVALQGGCLYVNGSEIEQRDIPSMPLYLINTGTPVSSTGQCVENVAAHFKSPQLADDFAAVTKAMDEALKQQSWTKMRDAVRANHQLLTKIGVVPERVQEFIGEVVAINGAAKISGAGAIAGQQAGIVFAMAEDENKLMSLSKRFGYEITPVSCETRGVHAA